MTLFAYAVRRTIGAVTVFLIVVLLAQFAVSQINRSPRRGVSEAAGRPVSSIWDRMDDDWASFPATALAALALLAGLVVVRRRLAP